MSRKSLTWIICILAVSAILLKLEHCSYAQLSETLTMESITKKITSKFNQVQHITTSDLAKTLSQTDKKSTTLLIDSRAAEEFAVSHLPGAQNLQSPAEVKTYLASLPQAPERIVIYCSVGYRSADLATQLQNKQSTTIPIQNLLGSIFSWANEDRPLVKGKNTPTVKVHPFNKKWGSLLKAEHHSE